MNKFLVLFLIQLALAVVVFARKQNENFCRPKNGITEVDCMARMKRCPELVWRGDACKTPCGIKIQTDLQEMYEKAEREKWSRRKINSARKFLERQCRPKTFKDGGCQLRTWCGYKCPERCKPQWGCEWLNGECQSSNSTNSTRI